LKNTKTKGNLILLFTAFIWGFAFAFQNQAGALCSPFLFGASRMTLAAISVGGICFGMDARAGKLDKNFKLFKEEERNKDYKKSTWIGGIVCGLFMGVATTFQQMGLMYTSAGKAGFVTAMYILLVPIASAIILKKKSSIRVWIAVAIAVGGMYLLCVAPGEDFSLNKGDILTLCCAFFFTFQIIFADMFVPRGNPIKIAALEFIIIGVLSWILAFIFEDPSIEMIKAVLVPILYCGLISGALGYTLQLVGQRYTDPTSASLIMSLESVFAVIGGAILLSEKMSVRESIGCVIMFAAIILVQLPSKK